MNSTWRLIEENKFVEAVEFADIQYGKTGSILELRNKLLALLNLRKYEEAITLSNRIITIENGDADSDFILSSISFWALGRRNEAMEILNRAEKCIYSDAMGGVELYTIEYFAAIKTSNAPARQRAVKAIAKLIKNRRSISWPGPLGKFILGNITGSELLSQIPIGSPRRDRFLCQAYFTMAIRALEKEDFPEYWNMLGESTRYTPMAFLERMY